NLAASCLVGTSLVQMGQPLEELKIPLKIAHSEHSQVQE
ncbi:MAG TPA: low-complexity protein, partial [Cyanobacteria bacterium UBA11371]|nr:low-complexity protein [Cyanobacteria bacterium UBA11371]